MLDKKCTCTLVYTFIHWNAAAQLGQYIDKSTGSLSQCDSFCAECFWLIHNNELSKDIYKCVCVCVCVCVYVCNLT